MNKETTVIYTFCGDGERRKENVFCQEKEV